MLAVLEADRLRVAELQPRILNIRHVLGSACVADSDFDFEKQIQDLGRFSSDLGAAQERLESYKYPVLTLPSELVSEILLHVLPRYPPFLPLTGPLDSPTVLTQICRRWREIALGTPQLWSGIDLDDRDQRVDTVHSWLERSRCRPLDLSLGRTKWATSKRVEALVPHRARWRNLNFVLEAEDLHIFDGPMPLLRKLELTIRDPEMALGEDFPDSIVLSEVPLLRTITFNDVAARLVILPYAQLTSLTLFNVYPSECVPILAEARNLVDCILNVYLGAPPQDDHPRPRRDITLPCLESLILSKAKDPVPDFLSIFIVPALRNLKVPKSFLAPNPVDSLSNFLSKSGCTLETLQLTGREITPAKVYREAFPSIRWLYC